LQVVVVKRKKHQESTSEAKEFTTEIPMISQNHHWS
jgi:hypothetical protein